MLILNKKAISNQDHALFKSELEKFRPHQNRIIQANHKQSSLMKELTRTYGDLLQDKRVRTEQNKYESFSRQRNSVMSKYRKVYQAYTDLQQGLQRAERFYAEMKETVESLQKNVQGFVENRRSEGGQLLGAIEAAKGSGADREQIRLKEMMDRMSVNPAGSHSPSPGPGSMPGHRPPPLQPQSQGGYGYNPAASPPMTPQHPNHGGRSSNPNYPNAYPQQQPTPTNGTFRPHDQYPQQRERYNPNSYGPVSPPAQQQYFSPPPPQQPQQQQQGAYGGYGSPPLSQHQQPYGQSFGGQQGMPAGWQPPPPPPGPPPATSGQDYGGMQGGGGYTAGPGGYGQDLRRSGGQQGGQQAQDPWAGLGAWK